MKGLALLALVTCLAYLPSLGGGYVYEDTNLLPALQQPFAWSQVPHPRAVTLLTFRLVSDPLWSHLFSVSVHLMNGLLLYTLVRTRLSEGWALAVVGVFWLHPIQTEAVAYLSGRGELLACMGVFVAWWAALTLRELPAVVVVTLAGLVAVGAKEASVCGLLVGLAIVTRQWVSGAIWAGLALRFAAALPTPWPLADLTWIGRQLALAGTYSGRFLWPVHQSVQAPTIDPVAGLLFVAGLTACIAWRPTRFAGVWVLLALAPRLLLAQPLPIQPEPLHEHHLYVLLPGLLAGLAMAAHGFMTRKESLCLACA